MNQMKAGAALSYASIAITSITGLLLTPYIVRVLGTAEFGLYTLTGAVVGYISLLDFGLGSTIIRFVAQYRALRDKDGETQFLATTFWLYLVIAMIVLAAGWAGYRCLGSVFGSSLTPAELHEAGIMFRILVFNIAISLPGNLFAGICWGYEAFVFSRAGEIIKYILRAVLLLCLLYLGGKAIAIVVLDTVMNLLLVAARAWFVRKRLHIKFRLPAFDRAMAGKILGYAAWMFVFAIVLQFQWKAGQAILGAISGTTAVAVYAVGVMLGTYYGAFSSAMSNMFLPKATAMIVSRAPAEALTQTMIRTGRVLLIPLLFILISFFLYGKQFVVLWAGKDYTASWMIAFIIMLAITNPLVQSFGNAILEASNRFAFKSLTYLALIIAGTAAGGYLARSYGTTGMITGTVAAMALIQGIMNLYYHYYIGLHIPRFYAKLLEKIAGAAVLALMAGHCMNLIPGEGWMNFFVKTGSFAVAYAVIMFYTGMHGDEQRLFGSVFHSLYRKQKRLFAYGAHWFR